MKKILLFCICISLVASQKSISEKTYETLKKANIFIKNKNFHSAIVTLNQLQTSTDQEKTHVLTLLSDAYLAQSNYKQASIYLEKLLQVPLLDAKRKKDIASNLMQVYLAQKQYKKAISTLITYKIEPNPKLYANIALGYLNLKNYPQALAYAKKALVKEPKNSNFMQILIAIYTLQNNQTQLCATLETAHSLKILNNDFIKQLAYCLYKQGAPLRGANLLQKSLNENSVKNSFENQKLLFNLFFASKEYEKALNVANNLHETQSSLLIAQTFYSKGEYDKTINIAKSFNFKNSPIIKILQAQSYYYKNDFQNAKKLFKEALDYPHVAKNAASWLNFMKKWK